MSSEKSAAIAACLADPPPDLLKYLLNDHGNAERLIALYGTDLCYCHSFKKWLAWDGRRWMIDKTGQARRFAKHTIVEFLKQAVDNDCTKDILTFAKQSLNAKAIFDVLSMAESDIFIRTEELDTDPYSLNFLNGTVDLRTGELQSHRKKDYITKLIHYDYRPGASCPRWLAFLEEITGGGPDSGDVGLARSHQLIDYLQRAFGYSLTGCTNEKAVFVLFGPSDAGKSTMLSTVRHITKEYGVLLQAETLMVRRESNNTQADLADLMGARFAQTSETEEGQRLAQGKLKRISQGMGTIKAVRKYENPIEFPETHKLWIDTNSKPTIQDADDQATFNRLHPIPLTTRIPKDRVDRDLPSKLLKEAEGILAWIVIGAMRWHQSGLKKPPEVEAANTRWRVEMDKLGRFVEERCITGDGHRAKAQDLYDHYKEWAEASGEKSIMSATSFGLKLPERGFKKENKNSGVIYIGIAIRSADPARGG